MDPNTPLADTNGPPLPHGAAAQPLPPPPVGIAQPAPGAVQQPPAPPPRRNRSPRGLITTSSSSGPSSAPALLELSAAYPMYTEQRRAANFYIPDAQMLFHALSICDSMMNATDRFLRSSPAWLPIVSQLYISVLWNVMIIRVFVNSGYGAHFSQLLYELINHLRIDECMVPGPLVPFFQSIAAVNGPFEWIGDIVPAFPLLNEIWDSETFSPANNYARQIPAPVVILDQLYFFATCTQADVVAARYTNFEWYRNIFSLAARQNPNIRLKIGPQNCGSLYTTKAQFDAAYDFWHAALHNNFTRINAAAGQPAITDSSQFLGFVSQTGTTQINWFQHVAIVMQKYSQYFNGSAPLKSVLPTGIGASVIIGTPRLNTHVRNWLYPATADLESFKTTRFSPLREIPSELHVKFSHSDHELEEQAEQYAILTHTNMNWFPTVPAQNGWAAVQPGSIHTGDYWNLMKFRFSQFIAIKPQFAQLIASRYHQQAANRAE